MIKFARILCPVDLDLSQASDEALRYALALARAYGAHLFVTYCAEGVEPDNVHALKATCGRAGWGGRRRAAHCQCAPTEPAEPAASVKPAGQAVGVASRASSALLLALALSCAMAAAVAACALASAASAASRACAARAWFCVASWSTHTLRAA